jgi:HEAT repeat protein
MSTAFRSGLLAGLVLGVALGGGAVLLLRRAPPAGPPCVETELAATREALERLKRELADRQKKPAPAPAEASAPESDAPPPPEPAPPAAPPDVKSLFEAFAKQGFAALYATDDIAKILKAVKDAGPAGIEFLTGILRNSPSATERFLAAALLEGTKDPSAIPALAESLKLDKDPIVRRMSSHALAVLENPAAEDPLRAAMTGDKDWGVRANAAYGVAKLGRDDGLRLLRQAYESGDTPPEYRIPILGGLADVADPSTAPLFRKILAEAPDESYLLLAIHALEKMKDVQSLPELQRVAADDHPETIKQAAQKAVEALRK